MTAMRNQTACPAEVPVVKPSPVQQLQPLSFLLREARKKIREDLFRFRTCCADPRASK